MSLVRLCSLLLALLTLASCADLVGFGESVPLVVAPAAGAVRVTNRSDDPVYYMAYEAGRAATSLWSPCTDDRCARIEPGESISIPNTDFRGYEQGDTQGIVYWWRVNGSKKPENHNICVDLR